MDWREFRAQADKSPLTEWSDDELNELLQFGFSQGLMPDINGAFDTAGIILPIAEEINRRKTEETLKAQERNFRLSLATQIRNFKLSFGVALAAIAISVFVGLKSNQNTQKAIDLAREDARADGQWMQLQERKLEDVRKAIVETGKANVKAIEGLKSVLKEK